MRRLRTRTCSLGYVGMDLREFIHYRDNHRCVKCGSIKNLRVDHIIPVKKGGHPASPSNLQLLCHACNLSKAHIEDRGKSRQRVRTGLRILAKNTL
jgi:5-methylcytosine-specific restriction endonuclease McrA